MIIAWCPWHYSVTAKNIEERWNPSKYTHIRGSIRSTKEGCIIADELRGGDGFHLFKCGDQYFPHRISLERVS